MPASTLTILLVLINYGAICLNLSLSRAEQDELKEVEKKYIAYSNRAIGDVIVNDVRSELKEAKKLLSWFLYFFYGTICVTTLIVLSPHLTVWGIDKKFVVFSWYWRALLLVYIASSFILMKMKRRLYNLVEYYEICVMGLEAMTKGDFSYYLRATKPRFFLRRIS